MTIFKRISVLFALGACLAVAGCGADDEGGRPIPRAQAQQLLNQLNIVQARLENGTEGACKDVLEAQDANDDAVSNIVTSLPSGVDPDVRDALQESFDNLWSLVESKCQDLKPDEPVQTETTTEPETDTTETTPPATETTEPETDTTTAPEEAPLPNEGDGDNGGAIPPNSNGGGVGPGDAKQKKEKGQ